MKRKDFAWLTDEFILDYLAVRNAAALLVLPRRNISSIYFFSSYSIAAATHRDR